MKRREFIAGLGGAAVESIWLDPTKAQQTPVVGHLSYNSRDAIAPLEVPYTLAQGWQAFHRGLNETGYVEGRNLIVEHRWADYRLDRLPSLAADLVQTRVRVIIVAHTTAALAVKAATNAIPIAFAVGLDPVEIGLVASLSRPSGNATGFYTLNDQLTAKRLQLLHEAGPGVTSIAYLANPSSSAWGAELREVQRAARALGITLLQVDVSEPSELESAISTVVSKRVGALLVGGEGLFFALTNRIIALTARYRLPASYPFQATAAEGLMSYGTDFPDLWRQVGVYAGRILNGEIPGDLPVQQVTKVNLVINLKTAKALGLTVPDTLLALADEVIE